MTGGTAARSAAVAIVLCGCHRASPSAPVEEAGVAEVEAGPLAPARCRRTDRAMSLGEANDLEIGDAVAGASGLGVALVHRTSAGRGAAVALLPSSLTGTARVVELGATLGDAPPPRIARRGADLVAAAYMRPAGKGDAGTAEPMRAVGVYTLAGDALAGAPLVVAQHQDESLALDVAFAGNDGLMVWDEATSAPRGVVKAAAFTRDRAEAARDVSPTDSDAELPRVVPSGAGFLVFWIARKPEAAVVPEAAAPAEATGEPRSFGWLEMTATDVHGSPVGSVRRLTSASGHLSAYDVAVDRVEAPPRVLVVARDDGEATDGSGGALVHLRIRGDEVGTVEPIVTPVTDGLGRGAPGFVLGSAGQAADDRPLALVWAGKDEETRLLPVGAGGEAAGRPSTEDAVAEAQPLRFVGGEGRPESEVLVAAPADPAGPLRVFACSRQN